MKIKLINYPYGSYKVGEICDFGEEKNASLVSFQRAVWAEEGKKESKKIVEEVVEETSKASEDEHSSPSDKKFLQNELQQEVQERKLVLSEAEGEELEESTTETPTSDTTDQDSGQEKQFLQNELKDQVEQKKAKTAKKSFWDNLK